MAIRTVRINCYVGGQVGFYVDRIVTNGRLESRAKSTECATAADALQLAEDLQAVFGGEIVIIK